MGFDDSTTGYQATMIPHAGTVKKELHFIDVSNEVDSGFTIPTRLASRLLGWVGHACFSLGSVCGHMGSPITNMSLCAGPVLEVSIGDASEDTADDANSRFVAVVWGW